MSGNPKIIRRRPMGGGLLTTASTIQPPATSDGPSSTSPQTTTSTLHFDGQTSIIDLSADDAGPGGGFVPPAPQPAKKRKLAPKLAKPESAKNKQKQKEPVFQPDVPFPDHFVQLEKTFKALNTVYTFCQARKSMAVTFDLLQSSVEKLIKRPLEMIDIGQIKSLLPELVTFAYIDAELMRIHATGANADDEKSAAADKRRQRMQELDEEFEKASLALAAEAAAPSARPAKKDVVLMFSFNDPDLKSSNGLGKVVRHVASRSRKTPGQKDYRPPEIAAQFTTESMSTVIDRRNAKFRAAVAELLVACAAHHPPQDPVDLLMAATQENLPVKPGDDLDGYERKGRSERKEDLEFYQRNPDKRPSIESILQELQERDDYREQIVENGHRTFQAREAVYGDLEKNLSESLWDALYTTKSIKQLYSHQAQAINHLNNDRHVIVSTSTSSGKSLIYQIPAIAALEQDPESTAIYIYPTKALAQDQKRALGQLLANCDGMEDVKIATFDGDTPREDRDYIRENASIIFTNPDMLHLTVLPREEQWRRFFSNLKFVVVDELHMYAGLFGCHVAFVMRRLRRLCEAVGNDRVKFISCSATIANPKEHMKTIFGIEDVELVDIDGSPSGNKEFIIWNPPYIDENDPKQGRVHSLTETSRLFRFMMERGIRVIVFCKVRAQCELFMKQVRNDLMAEGRSDMAARVMSYRSGYNAADRRKIEQDMFSGQLLGIIATTALELGIDIGSLDAVITVGFPYTLPGLRQQAGRAGRRNKDSLAMLICDPWPLDQHYARNPDEIFASPFTQLTLDLENPIVLEAHIQCAANEVPIQVEADSKYFGPKLAKICQERLIADSDRYFHPHPRYKPNPAKSVPIRNTEDESYLVVDISEGRNQVIEEVEVSRAIFTTYEGAVYHHMGRTFLVREVNHERKVAKVERAAIEWKTQQRDYTDIDPAEPLAIRQIVGSPYTACYGTVTMTSVVFGYFKTDRKNNILDTVDIQQPPFRRTSHGFWIDVPASALEILILKNLHPAASIHAAEHALMSLTPIVALCAEGDVRTECKQPEKEFAASKTSRKRPARLILYDTAGQSGGITAKAFDHISMLLRQAADTIAKCKCLEGCPSFVSKLGALVVLESILNRPIDVDKIPMQERAVGVTPGGTVDLVAAGVRREILEALASGTIETFTQDGGHTARLGVMEKEELGADEEAEREAALAELLGGSADDVQADGPQLGDDDGVVHPVAPLLRTDLDGPEEDHDDDFELDEEAERELALAELLGGQGDDVPNPRERQVFAIEEGGGFEH
ncbi:ATP-dependent 3'-5' DNA helicase [Microbotryomycetes sp. JL201]|nr:ATP-dependent 3'-5' DNA helicase [Microbotryomycetes sp. JL201]